MLGAATTADAVLFIGTSFSVGVTDLLVNAALERHRPIVSIDPTAAAPSPEVVALRSRAEELLPAACQLLGADVGPTTAGT